MTCPTALLRHCATPPLAFPKRVAFGAALRGGCAAAHLRQQQTLRFLPVKQDNNIQNLPVTLQTISIQSPIRSLISGASLRDRATLPSPLRGLDPSGGYPSPLRSLRSLRAPLGPAVRIAHRRLPERRRSALLPLRGSSAFVSSSRRRYAPCSSTPLPRLSLPASPASARASAWRALPTRASARLAGVRIRDRRLARSRAEPRPLSRRRGCPAVPPPGPFPPTFGTLDQVLSTPFGGSALTPDAAGCPDRHHILSTKLELPSTYLRVRPSTHKSCSCRAGKCASHFASHVPPRAYISNINALSVGYGPLARLRIPQGILYFHVCVAHCVPDTPFCTNS